MRRPRDSILQKREVGTRCNDYMNYKEERDVPEGKFLPNFRLNRMEITSWEGRLTSICSLQQSDPGDFPNGLTDGIFLHPPLPIE